MIIYYGIDFVYRSFNLNEVSAALTGLSHRWIIKSFIPLGMLLLLLAGLSILIKNVIFIVAKVKNDKEVMNILIKKDTEFKES